MDGKGAIINYYKHHIGDYTRDAAHLTMQEDGCYRRMLDLYYAEEKPLPLEMPTLYRKLRARAKDEQKTVDTMLAEYFTRYEDGWRHGRCDREIIAMQGKADSSRENGTHGGRPQKPDDNPTETQQVPKENPRGSYAGAGPLPTTHKAITPLPTKPLPSTQKVKTVSAAPTVPTWTAYADAYKRRYGIEPLRNAKVNGLLAKFLDRVPAEEAPGIAAFFLTSNRSLYVSAKHCADLLLRDAESLRTEWVTGRSVTDTEARQADRTQATGNAFAPLIQEAREREANASK